MICYWYGTDPREGPSLPPVSRLRLRSRPRATPPPHRRPQRAGTPGRRRAVGRARPDTSPGQESAWPHLGRGRRPEGSSPDWSFNRSPAKLGLQAGGLQLPLDSGAGFLTLRPPVPARTLTRHRGDRSYRAAPPGTEARRNGSPSIRISGCGRPKAAAVLADGRGRGRINGLSSAARYPGRGIAVLLAREGGATNVMAGPGIHPGPAGRRTSLGPGRWAWIRYSGLGFEEWVAGSVMGRLSLDQANFPDFTKHFLTSSWAGSVGEAQRRVVMSSRELWPRGGIDRRRVPAAQAASSRYRRRLELEPGQAVLPLGVAIVSVAPTSSGPGPRPAWSPEGFGSILVSLRRRRFAALGGQHPRRGANRRRWRSPCWPPSSEFAALGLGRVRGYRARVPAQKRAGSNGPDAGLAMAGRSGGGRPGLT